MVFIFVPKYGANDIGTNFRLVYHPLVAVHICQTIKNCQFGHILKTSGARKLVLGSKDVKLELSYLL